MSAIPMIERCAARQMDGFPLFVSIGAAGAAPPDPCWPIWWFEDSRPLTWRARFLMSMKLG